MKKLPIFLLLLALSMLSLLTSCINKDLDIDVSQTGCGTFAISSATYVTLSDPSCTGFPLVASYDITFTYSGNDACLHKIVIESNTRISDADGNRIDSTAYAMEFSDTSAIVHIDRNLKQITYRFDITFQNSDDAKNFNDAYIVFHCENTEGDATKPAKVHIYGTCSAPPSNIGSPINTIHVNSDTIRVKLWDNAEEDGDIVSIYLNGVWVLTQYRLTNAPRTFYWPILNPGTNDLILVANNQGTVGPNTCSISINGGFSTSVDLDLQTGAVIRIL